MPNREFPFNQPIHPEDNQSINRVFDRNYGNKLKSGDTTTLKYTIKDGDGEPLDKDRLIDMTTKVILKYDGIIAYETSFDAIVENETDNYAGDLIARFKIEEVLPPDVKKPYIIEFHFEELDQSDEVVDRFIFPSGNTLELFITPSALNSDSEAIGRANDERLDNAVKRAIESDVVLLDIKDQEQQRIDNETARQSAENAREETFATNETDRQSTFDTNENARQETFENNESERQTNYNELVDTGIMQENINQKLSESEQTYAPRLTNLEQNDANLTAQLAHTAYVAIKPNGVDDTDAIQAKVDELDSRGGGTLIIPRGVYWINASKHGVGRNKKHGVKLPSNIRIEMKNAVLKVIPNNDEDSSVFFLDNVENTQIVGGVIEGDKFDHLGTTGEWGHGLNIQGVDTKNILIEKLQVKNCWGDGIYIRDVFGGNIVFDGITVEDCRRHEMAIIGGQDIKIIHSKMTKSSDIKDNVINTSYGGLNIDVESHNGERSWTKDISIDGCTFDNKINTCVRFDDSYVNENVRVSNSLFYNRGLQGGNGSNYIINNNKIVPSSDPLHIGHGIRLSFVENGVINNNIIEGVNWGISTEYSGKDISISNNTIKNCKSNGILVRGDADTRDYTIDDNSITNCGFDGIRESYRNSLGVIGYSENKIYNIKISNNRISESPYGGIYIGYVDTLSITNNNIENFQVKIEDDVNRLVNNLVRVTGSNTISFNSNMLVLSKQPQNERTPTQFSGCDNVTVVGNKCVKKEGIVRSSILQFYNTTNSFVTSNDFYESHDRGTYYHGPPTLSSNNRLNDGTLEVSGS